MVQGSKKIEIPANTDLRLLDAIIMAGGRSIPYAQKIRVTRMVEGRPTPIYIKTTFSKAEKDGNANIRLMTGDIVDVEETPPLLFLQEVRRIVNFGIGGTLGVL